MDQPPRVPVLGELERHILARLWDDGPSDAKALHRAVGRARRITLNTVQSTVERLYRKGLLEREKVSHAYVYSPRLSRTEFGARMMQHFVRDLLGGNLEPVLAAFVDLTARTGQEELARLEELVAARRVRSRSGQ